ncbi:MAG TPA: SDR family NAD(P)-dependent oxidoreductase, partial [Kofleriaceae bacterium]
MWNGLDVLVTGATGGIGRPLCEALRERGARVIPFDRETCDLSSLAAVRDVPLPPVDVLINNAGVGFGANQTQREVSADGIELRFAVNYLAPYSMTQRLLARGLRAIVNVASAGQRALDFDDLLTEEDYDGITAYRRSKLAMIMWSFDLAEAQAVPVVSLHPGTFL